MPLRSQAEIDVIIANGQDTLGDLALKVVKQKNSGIAYGPDLKDNYYRLVLLDNYLRMVIDPDTEEVPEYLLLPENDVKLNKLLDAIYKLSDIFDVPGVPITGRRRPPMIFAGLGQPGTPGTSGTDGANANIIVASDPDYDNIHVKESNVGPTKIYELGYAPYTMPVASIAIQGGKVKEIGDVVETLTILVSSTKGRELITRREIVSPPGISLINADLNDPGPQDENVFVTDVDGTTTFNLEVEDDRNIVPASDTLTFVYPFLSGDTPGTSPDHYMDLDKLIATKSDKQIILNGVGKYFWFGYPATYGDLAHIYDQNGFDVTGSFTKVTVNVSSQNLDNNWVNVSYIFYRTTVATTINNGQFTFDFP